MQNSVRSDVEPSGKARKKTRPQKDRHRQGIESEPGGNKDGERASGNDPVSGRGPSHSKRCDDLRRALTKRLEERASFGFVANDDLDGKRRSGVPHAYNRNSVFAENEGVLDLLD